MNLPRPIRYMTVDDVAGLLRVSRMTIYREIRALELGAVRVGRSIRIPVSALRDYLTAHGMEAELVDRWTRGGAA